ncbi:HAD family phosphatase [Bacillus sp. RG28]|uniref:HAD family phosphatase n=1 Tax=Gottfriedia endophytica TaxID=2820819 RepID=A0A940SJ95_9BACI|nr:HAD family phosphatase [Gottfriedia endophytica]MBP0723993.1 HAD family phosphatase [Gottfriedia endophytica]
MSIKAIIFDMDGLMFDSERVTLEAIKKIGQAYQYVIEDEHVHEIIGTNQKYAKKRFQERFGEDFPFEDIMKQKKVDILEYYQTEGVPKKEGLVELLEYLKEKKLPLAVATSSYRESATFILKKAEVFPYFDAIICGDEVTHSKPEPEIFLKAASTLGVYPEECIVIEDSENGLIAAQKAGIRSIFVKDLVTPKNEVLAKVFKQADTLRDVIEILKSHQI